MSTKDSLIERKSSQREASDPTFTEQLPIHFFTIVLNGEPFIHYHINIFQHLPFRWHWHIVEGVAELKHDTAWSVKSGGRITDDIHNNGRSNDGTSEYIDELLQLYPENITVYRKQKGMFWDGKREMVNAPLANIPSECLLWQVDVDELWTVEQLCKARQMFIHDPEKTAAFYWCWYFVGEKLVISSRHCYAQNPEQEWLRTWRFQPGSTWATHEPPKLVQPLEGGKYINIDEINPFSHQETERMGLVFQHFAYVIPAQLLFKEQFYGYSNALSQWRNLQTETQFPARLSRYFSWVRDETLVDTAETCGVLPLFQKQPDDEKWYFLQAEDLRKQSLSATGKFPRIVLDGGVFQFSNIDLNHRWRLLLEKWSRSNFATHITIIDRAGTAPRIDGLHYRSIPLCDHRQIGMDSERLQKVCTDINADLFISSCYTAPTSTPSVFLAYEKTLEKVDVNFSHLASQEKRYLTLSASAYVATSEDTAQDLVKLLSHVSSSSVFQDFVKVIPFSETEFSEALAETLMQVAEDIKLGTVPSVHPLWSELRQLQIQLQQRQLLQSERDLQRQLEKSQKIIKEMETSIFWRLRVALLRLKKMF